MNHPAAHVRKAILTPNYATLDERRYRRNLFNNFESRALTMTRSRAVQHCANGVNRLAVATNDSANVCLAQLHFEDSHFAARDLRENHVVREFDKFANDEFEKFFHAVFEF